MADTNHENLRDRPLGELVEQLSADVRDLVRAELALAKAELAERGRRFAVAGGLAVAGAVLGLLALGTFTATAVIALANVWPAWLAALVVALVLGVLAGLLLSVGIRVARRAVPPTPADTMESIKEDVEWVKTRARSGMT